MTARDGGGPGGAVDRLVEVVELLRRHCPWTAALDHASLLKYLVEETYELYEAADDVARAGSTGPDDALLDDLRGELGDVLFQVVLHAQLQAERNAFGFADVARGLTDKLVRRNPHVFAADGSLRDGPPASVEDIVAAWQRVKQAEKPERASPFDGIPGHLPALALAAKTLARVDDGQKVPRDAGEGQTQGEASSPADPEAAVGAELLAVTRRALSAGIDPERALRHAVLELQRAHAARVNAH